tara:strand:+ start:202 stop:465 length:264 start_codon:yes stop_codon:yes gene_type:complete
MKSLLLLIILLGISLVLSGFIMWLSGEGGEFLLLGLLGVVLSLFLIVYTKMKWENDFIYLFIKTRLKRGSQKIRSAKEKMRKELEDE